MTVVIISKTQWNVVTRRNITSITLSGGTYTVTDGTTATTYAAADYYIRIMES